MVRTKQNVQDVPDMGVVATVATSPRAGHAPRSPHQQRRETFRVRVTFTQRQRWDEASRASAITTSEWVRRICDEASTDPKDLTRQLRDLAAARSQLNKAIISLPETGEFSSTRELLTSALASVQTLIAENAR